VQLDGSLIDGSVRGDSPEDTLPLLLASSSQLGCQVVVRLALFGEVYVEEHVAWLYLSALDGQTCLERLGIE
jgi:hypothetical protein